MTAASPPRRRKPAGSLSMPPGAWEQLVRSRGYNRPLEAVPPLHVMARRQQRLAYAASQRTDNTKETGSA
jgi:hypothetical protein